MIDLDNAATTSVHPLVIEAVDAALRECAGNPSSIHQAGRRAKQALDAARNSVARLLGAPINDIVFTSGGTESIHMALFGVWLASRNRVFHPHFVASAVEHHAVLHTLDFLKTLGCEVTLVPVNKEGRVQLQDVVKALQPNTVCVSIMTVNNEMGTIQPVWEIASRIKSMRKEIVIHSDMVQALGTMKLSLKDAPIDLASFSAHKIRGPKGVGALYIRPGTRFKPSIYGGEQERKRRAGTENIPGIVGFGEAARMLEEGFDAHIKHIANVREVFVSELRRLENFRLLSPIDAVPTIANVHFSGVRNDVLLMRLDLEGVLASAGSACTAGSIEPSHVLQACGYTNEIQEAVRFSFSDALTEPMVQEAAKIVQSVVRDLVRK